MSKVLEFGNHEEPVSTSMYPDEEIVIKPMTGEWWVEKDGPYKGIFSFYNYHKTPYHLEQRVIDTWKNNLEPEGVLHVIVPSWNFLCRMAMQPKIEAWVKPMMLDATNFFTMSMLRIIFSRSGLKVLKARTGAANLELYGQKFEIEQHYIAGQKE